MSNEQQSFPDWLLVEHTDRRVDTDIMLALDELAKREADPERERKITMRSRMEYKATLPRKGWLCVEVSDHGDYLKDCQWCGVAQFRYGHLMTHPEVADQIEVGCVCAEKMAQDYNGKAAERKMRSIESNRRRFNRVVDEMLEELMHSASSFRKMLTHYIFIAHYPGQVRACVDRDCINVGRSSGMDYGQPVKMFIYRNLVEKGVKL